MQTLSRAAAHSPRCQQDRQDRPEGLKRELGRLETSGLQLRQHRPIPQHCPRKQALSPPIAILLISVLHPGNR